MSRTEIVRPSRTSREIRWKPVGGKGGFLILWLRCDHNLVSSFGWGRANEEKTVSLWERLKTEIQTVEAGSSPDSISECWEIDQGEEPVVEFQPCTVSSAELRGSVLVVFWARHTRHDGEEGVLPYSKEKGSPTEIQLKFKDGTILNL